MHKVLSTIMIVIFLVPITACHKETEEDKVRSVLKSIQTAAGEKKIMAVLEHVSKTYQDPQGNDHNGIKGLLAFYFFRHQKVSVYIPNSEVVVTGQSAKAVFQAILTGGGPEGETQGSLLPESLGAYDFTVQFKKEEGRWKVTSAAWARAGEGGLPGSR